MIKCIKRGNKRGEKERKKKGLECFFFNPTKGREGKQTKRVLLSNKKILTALSTMVPFIKANRSMERFKKKVF